MKFKIREFFLVILIILIGNNCLCKFSFDAMKGQLMKEFFNFKLENYLRKMNIKNIGMINNFIFVEDNDLNKISSENDLNFEQMKTEEFDEFKARVFSYLYMNKENNSGLIYKPLGVNKDVEKLTGYKIYIVLINNNKDSNQKLLKVCFRENQIKENFAIVLKFDQNCKEIIDKMEVTGVFKEDHSEVGKKLHLMQENILNNNLREKLNPSLKNSFLEQSAEAIAPGKSYSFDSLAQKFSVEELTKIKSLIKFAKTNKIIEDIYSKQGDVKLEELIKNNYNNTSDVMKNDLGDLKVLINNQNQQFELKFNEMSKNFNGMKEMLTQVKEVSGELHKSMLVMGNNLKGGNNNNMKFRQIDKDDDNDDEEENKHENKNEIKKLAHKNIQNKIVKKKEIIKNVKTNIKTSNFNKNKKSIISKPVSPFLSKENFDDSTDDEEFVENVDKMKKKKNEENDSEESEEDSDWGDNFVSP